MSKSIDTAFKEIDKQFDKVQKKNKYLKYALLTPIHEKYPYAQNGITAMIASMGSGKTYTYLKLMKQQEVLLLIKRKFALLFGQRKKIKI